MSVTHCACVCACVSGIRREWFVCVSVCVDLSLCLGVRQ